MTVFRAEFQWALSVSDDTVQRYAELLAVRSGFLVAARGRRRVHPLSRLA